MKIKRLPKLDEDPAEQFKREQREMMKSKKVPLKKSMMQKRG